jgi:TatD DNase family protein
MGDAILNVEGLVDTHAHLSYLQERGIDAHAELRGLFGGGMRAILDIGTDAADLGGRISAFGGYPRVRFAAGNWPHADALPLRREKLARLEAEIAASPPGLVVAIGECGFDSRERARHLAEDSVSGFSAGEYAAAEREFLEMQLDLARRKGLPALIHSREAFSETLETLKGFPGLRAVIHCFSYGPAEAAAFLELGCFISFAGNLTYKNAAALREAAAIVPDERLLLETDSPYLPPVPHRGEACTPGMVALTYAAAASCRKSSLAALKAVAAHNAERLFFKGNLWLAPS